ncbi:hypothetical protein OAU50_06470 [Planctomycetota bacterium]|nr:hypothetical protein [Planctomycetota bacterium]
MDFNMYGYAFAKVAQLREESKPAWQGHIRLNALHPMKQAAKALKKNK